MTVSWARVEMTLDDVTANTPTLHRIIPKLVLDLNPVLLEHTPLYIAVILHHHDHGRAVPRRIFAAFKRSPLGVSAIPNIVEPTPAVIVEHNPDGIRVVTRQVQQIVQLGTSDTYFLDNLGVLD